MCLFPLSLSLFLSFPFELELRISFRAEVSSRFSLSLFAIRPDGRKKIVPKNWILMESFASTRISYIINWLKTKFVIEYLIHKNWVRVHFPAQKYKICFECIGFASGTFLRNQFELKSICRQIVIKRIRKWWREWVRISEYLGWQGWNRISDTRMSMKKHDFKHFLQVNVPSKYVQ